MWQELTSAALQGGSEVTEGRQRGSIAWDIPLDWDLDHEAAASASKKRRKEEPAKGLTFVWFCTYRLLYVITRNVRNRNFVVVLVVPQVSGWVGVLSQLL